MVTFEVFKDAFLQAISDKDFGEPEYSAPLYDRSALSPGARELRSSGALSALSALPYVRALYRRLREFQRLVDEQDAVERASRRASAVITRSRNARKTLNAVQKRITTLANQLQDLLPHWDSLRRACEQLESAKYQLVNIENDQASTMHASERKSHDKHANERDRYQTGAWKPLIKSYDYDYPLDSLNKKAPQQWLVETLDESLRIKLKAAEAGISDTTRYRIIAAVCQSAHISGINHGMIKQHFAERAKRRRTEKAKQHPAARNSLPT